MDLLSPVCTAPVLPVGPVVQLESVFLGLRIDVQEEYSLEQIQQVTLVPGDAAHKYRVAIAG